MLSAIKQHAVNTLGWRTKRKIIVFESDDWGMVRMASAQAYQALLGKGYPVDSCPYSTNDHLEREEDVSTLAEVLQSVRKENPPVFTLNNVVANPDFSKIKKDNFSHYHFLPFNETPSGIGETAALKEVYLQGRTAGVFNIQFHAREHVNVNRWMTALQQKEKRFMDAFEHGMYTVPSRQGVGGRRDYLDSFGRAYKQEMETEESIINSGLDIFKKIWGFPASSFIAPCYVWHASIEEVLSRKGIKTIQGTHVQRVPKSGTELAIKKKYHYMGQRNPWQQRYLVRNVKFEPTERGAEHAVDGALRDIALAFKYKKPAIISSHRVNYMGGLRPGNRDQNLKLLQELLASIVRLYPNVEFMSSEALGQVMEGKA